MRMVLLAVLTVFLVTIAVANGQNDEPKGDEGDGKQQPGQKPTQIKVFTIDDWLDFEKKFENYQEADEESKLRMLIDWKKNYKGQQVIIKANVTEVTRETTTVVTDEGEKPLTILHVKTQFFDLRKSSNAEDRKRVWAHPKLPYVTYSYSIPKSKAGSLKVGDPVFFSARWPDSEPLVDAAKGFFSTISVASSDALRAASISGKPKKRKGTWTRDKDGDWKLTKDDSNFKLVVENNVLKLAPDGDEFGSKKDAKWTHYHRVGKYKIKEKDGTVVFDKRVNSDSASALIRKRVAYSICDVACEWSDVDANLKATDDAGVRLNLFRDTDNMVCVAFLVRDINPYRFFIVKRINGVEKAVHSTGQIQPQERIQLRIKRDNSNNVFTFYYAMWDGAKWSAWKKIYSGTINDANHFNTKHTLYVGLSATCAVTKDDFNPKATKYWQVTDDISAQRFWDNSPECNIIDSSTGKVQYAFDAGSGNVWKLSGASAVVSEPSKSSVKFKIGFSNSPKTSSATWCRRGNWMAIAEVNTTVAAGKLNGRRYIFVKAQFNSDGMVQPSLSSFSIKGAKVAP
jgi:hypothetical protein